jgi:DNA-binding MarR family transcriptional regulator
MASASPEISAGVLAGRLTSPGLLLAMVGRAAMLRLRETHAANGLSPRQFHLLALLHDAGPLAQADLGTLTETDPSILVTMLNPLEDDGLISRVRDPQDRRRHVVTLTAAGEAHLRRAASAQYAAEDELFAGIDDAQREQLRVLLLELQHSLAGAGALTASCAVETDPCTTPAAER